MPIRKTLILRLLLLVVIITSFIILCTIFISQYKQYKEVEHRLNTAYANSSKYSPVLYDLFSTFSEVDNLFRLYAISFDDTNFKAYQDKLNTLNTIIQSIDTLSAENKSSAPKSTTVLDQSISFQYLALKKQIDDLIIFADQKLATNKGDIKTIQRNRSVSADSIINHILQDTVSLVQLKADTVVKKKENLFKRIFNAKNDTVLNKNSTEVLNINQINIVHKNIENLIRTNETSYKSNYANLRRVYLLSKEQERKLITSNYSLINDLKKTIDEIREIESLKLRTAEKDDYLIYKLNTEKFRTYALLALCVILLMLLFIMYYQYVVSKYETKLIKEKDYASLLVEEKTNLLANISHEIRTPLNSLKGVVKLLSTKNEEKLDESLLSNITYDINVINNTVNDILNLSIIESNTIDVVMDDVYISKIIDDTFGLHKYQATQKGLIFINQNNLEPLLQIKSNEFRLRQVISNLISNALKYTNRGSIKVVSKVVNDKIIIDVIDTGIGIAEEKLDQIFRKYYTVDGEKAKVGFGLGLHISQLLAKQIKGKLNVKSQLGVGSTFSFQLPNTRKEIVKINQTHSVRQLPKDISIVFIDDNKINLLLAKRTFEAFSNFYAYEDPSTALEYIVKHKPQIVITDVIMPKMSGWNVLETIKSNKNLSAVKVIANTGEVSLAENEKENLRFDGILEKGFDTQALSKIYYS